MAWAAYDTVKEALYLCGGVALGESPDAAIGAMGLDAFNAIRASMNLKGMTCYGASVLTIAADGSTGYTMGTGGDNAARPDDIAQVQWATSDTNIYTLTKLPYAEYQGLSGKAETTTAPAGWAVDGAFPLLTLYIYPAPQTGTIRVISRTPFAEIANLSDPVVDPPSYREAFRYLLADKMYDLLGLGLNGPSPFGGRAAALVDSILMSNVANNIPRVAMPLSYRYSTDGKGSTSGTAFY